MHYHMHYHIRYNLIISNHCWAPHWTTFKGPEIPPPQLGPLHWAHCGPPSCAIVRLLGCQVLSFTRCVGSQGHTTVWSLSSGVMFQGKEWTGLASTKTKNSQGANEDDAERERDRMRQKQILLELLLSFRRCYWEARRLENRIPGLRNAMPLFAREIQMGRCLSNSKALALMPGLY